MRVHWLSPRTAPRHWRLDPAFQACSYEDATTLAGAAGLAVRAPADIVVVAGPFGDGSDVALISMLRVLGVHAPICVLRDPAADPGHTVTLLNAGADDVVRPSVEWVELLARAQARVRRVQWAAGGPVTALSPQPSRLLVALGDAIFDPIAHTIRRGELVTLLTPVPYTILMALVRYRGVPMARDALAREIGGANLACRRPAIAQHVVFLRRAIEVDPTNPTVLLTVHGYGYVLARSATGTIARQLDPVQRAG